ncbi:MAG: YIP1 family protein [Acholeplasmataceae bacterium]
MKKIRRSIILILIVFLILLTPSVFSYELPYRTYTYNQAQGGLVFTQDAYLPLSISYQLDDIVLNNPQDISIDKEDNIYIADYLRDSAGNSNGYIIKYNLETNEVAKIGESILKEPTGVHIGFDSNVYVADNKSKEAYKFTLNEQSNEYELEATYKRPVNTPYFGPSEVFEPLKIVTDQGNVVYILLAGNENGLGKYENGGEFTGFFGGNQIPKTFENMVKSIFFNEEQRRNWFKMIPTPLSNVSVDQNGLIITTTIGQSGYLKLNIANFVYSESAFGYDDIEDVYVGPSGTIYTISRRGMISEYSPDGDLLFVFSGTDENNQKGLFQQPKGIAVDLRNNIYVIDNKTKSLQIFIPTHFANLVHNAIDLYQDGKYIESLEPWQKVLKMNSMFDLANKGIADAYFAMGDYENALVSYEIARDRSGYSDAFWEVRNVSLLQSGPIIVTVLLVLVLFTIVNTFFNVFSYILIPFKKLDKLLDRFKIYRELKFGFYVLRHPEDGFYGIKRENKSSNLTALIYIVLFFLSYILWIYNTNFIFNMHIKAEINLTQQMVFIFVPLFLWVLSNYLVCSIRDGEGKFSDVLQGTAYILIPLIIIFPILTFISHYLTFNEAFVYDFIFYLGIIVTLVYVILMVKEIHFYDLNPTIGNIFITIFTAVMILVFTAIIYLLFSEVISLIEDIIREVTIRG